MRGHDWQAIRDAYPLSSIVGKVVPLRRSGREMSGCCPFHDEKTASFYVNDEKQFYHCFGCGAHGDVIDFVAQTDRVEPAEAISRLTGGKAPTLTADDRRARLEWVEARSESRRKEQEQATLKARQRWERALPVEGTSNAYLTRKSVAPHSARMEGESLLLPIHDASGDIMSVQKIAPDGGKLFAAGAPVMGGRMGIGMHVGRTIICEGFATGASIFEAVVDQVFVAFSKANMHNIARELAAQGVAIVLAADTNAEQEMRGLGLELGCPVVIPSAGSDFNDQVIELGLESVRSTFSAAYLDFQNRPAAPQEPPFCAISFVEAFDFTESEIPLRPWMIPGALLAGSTHILAAPGGTGKSLFTLQLALCLASGERWGKWKPKRAYKVLIVNAEDDIEEQRRRLSAARTVMGLDTSKLAGRIITADNPSSILVSTIDGKGAPVATPLVEQLTAVIQHHGIDVVIVDPFAETFDGDENSNGDTKWAMKLWRDEIARKTGAAVYLVHHTTKGSEDKAGSADVIRGGGAIVNSARMAATLFVMSKAEAPALGVKEENRFRYVRYDDAKSNQSLIGSRIWFEKVSVVLQNGGDDGGDEVGALRPWEPDGIFVYGEIAVRRLLEVVETGYVDEDGVCTDQPFGRTSAGNSKRWIGYAVGDVLGLEGDDVRRAVRQFMDTGLLEEFDFNDTMKGRPVKGIRVAENVAKKLLPQLFSAS